jgi:hypothetical protein
MIQGMSDKDEPSVLGALPHSRPHRRSAKREMRPVSAETADDTTSTEPAATGTAAPKPAAEPSPGAPPPPRRAEREEPRTGDTNGADGMGTAELLTTVVQAAAELAEIGLTAGARALRIAVSRLPRP